MSIITHDAALFGTAGCGCHQQVLGGAIAGGDFTNIATNNAADGIYTLNGESIEIGDIIDLGNSSFDLVNDLDAEGIKAHFDDPFWNGINLQMTPALVAMLLADGFTAILDVNFANISTEQISVDVHGPGLTPNQSIYTSPSVGSSISSLTDYNEWATPKPGAGSSRIALTYTETKMSLSINGSAVLSLNDGGFNESCTNVAILFTGEEVARLRSFSFRAVAADADLPTLSAL